jgi:SHOCT-like domain
MVRPMPDDALARVLEMVADGRLTAAEAAPIIEALEYRAEPGIRGAGVAGPAATAADDEPGRLLRVVVTESGRPVVNLNIPLSLGRAAINRLPGLSGPTSDLIRQAIEVGRKASIVEIDDDGDGVRISIE